MKPKTPHHGEQGFTLIELVVVVVLLSITAAAIIQLNAGLYKSGNSMRDLQSDTQLLQACAEHVLATRRLTGFDDTPDYDTACESLAVATKADNNNFDVTTTPNYTGNSCPVGATCQWVDIKVNSTVGALGPMTLQLMKY
jgi:prepilin-type N-terminal cleavage/methylation domain-containing protein